MAVTRAESLIRSMPSSADPGDCAAAILLSFLLRLPAPEMGTSPFRRYLWIRGKGDRITASHSTREPGLITIGDLTALLSLASWARTGKRRSWARAWEPGRCWPRKVAIGRQFTAKEIILRVYLYLLIIMLMLALVYLYARTAVGWLDPENPAGFFLPLTFLLIAVLKITNWPLLVMLLLSAGGFGLVGFCQQFAAPRAARAPRSLLSPIWRWGLV